MKANTEVPARTAAVKEEPPFAEVTGPARDAGGRRNRRARERPGGGGNHGFWADLGGTDS